MESISSYFLPTFVKHLNYHFDQSTFHTGYSSPSSDIEQVIHTGLFKNLKKAITSTGPYFDSLIEQRFGYCRYFILIDPITEDFEVFDNTPSLFYGEPDIETAQKIIHAKTSAVITGQISPKATQILTEAGIKVYIGALGTVRQALQQYRASQLCDANLNPYFLE